MSYRFYISNQEVTDVSLPYEAITDSHIRILDPGNYYKLIESYVYIDGNIIEVLNLVNVKYSGVLYTELYINGIVPTSGILFIVKNWTEIPEPEGFDGFEYNLIRSQTLHGVDNIYSETELKLEYPYSELLIDAYNKDLFDASNNIKIIDECTGDELNGILNYAFFEQNGLDASIKMEDSSFDRKFKNRISTKVNLDAGIGIEGNIIENNYQFIKLHRKEYIQIGLFEKSQDSILINQEMWLNKYLYIPVAPTVTEIEGQYNPGGFYVHTGSDYGLFEADADGQYTIKLRLKGIHSAATPAQDPTVNLNHTHSIVVAYGDVTTGSASQTIGLYTETNTFVFGRPFDIDFTTTLDLVAGDKITVYHFMTAVTDVVGNPLVEWYEVEYELASFDIEAQLSYPASTCRGYDLFDAFRITTEAITGQKDSFRSDLLTSGCARLIHYTNGLNIRNIKDKDGSYHGISTSFEDLYNDLNVYTPISVFLVKEGNKSYIRLEERIDQYTTGEAMVFPDVKTFRRYPALDMLNSEIEIGYSEYQSETYNGLDEFNGRHTYAFDVNNISKKLTLISGSISSGYIIEYGRRIQYQTNPTRDWKFDNVNFFISKNRITVDSDRYGDGNSTYSVGTVSERNELFPVIENLFSPDTVYNPRFSPKRCILRHYPFISNVDKNIKFQTGNCNTLLRTLENSSCNVAMGILEEGADIDESVPSDSIAAYGTSYIEYEYPITIKDFNIIKENVNKQIKLTFCDMQFSGYLISCKLKPLTPDGSIAEFKIIESGQCVPGAFNEGFNEGFRIGTC